MRLNLSGRASRNFKRSTILSAIIGLVIGLIIVGCIPGLQIVLLWILVPLIIAVALPMLVVGFYLIFLNRA